MGKLDILDAYRISKEALEGGAIVELSKGLKVRMRPFKSPIVIQTYSEYTRLNKGKDVDSMTEEELLNDDATIYTLAHAIIVSLGVGEGEITDKDVIIGVLKDPCYFELKREILEVCQDSDNFRDAPEEEIPDSPSVRKISRKAGA